MDPLPYFVTNGYLCFAVRLDELDEDQREALEQLIGSLPEVSKPDHS